MGLWGKGVELIPKGRKSWAPQGRLVIAEGCIPESFLEEVVAELSLAQGACSIASTAVVIHSRSKGHHQEGNCEWKTIPIYRNSCEKRQAVLCGRRKGEARQGKMRLEREAGDHPGVAEHQRGLRRLGMGAVGLGIHSGSHTGGGRQQLGR